MMIDRQLESLKDVPVPPARDEAKARALAAAMAAFAPLPIAAAKPAASNDGTQRDGVRKVAGPRPFALRHGYKIAAGLAAFAVIGPMIALWQVPLPRDVRETTGKSQNAAPPAPAKELRAAPPVVVASPPPAPSVAQDATPAAKRSDAAPPVQLSRPSMRATIAPPPAAPAPGPQAAGSAVAAAETQPRERSARAAPARNASNVQAWAGLATALDAGQLPDPATVDGGALLNAFDMPSVRSTGRRVVIRAPSPWSSQWVQVLWQPGVLDKLNAGLHVRLRPTADQMKNANAETRYDTLAGAPDDVRFAIAVARFTELLRGTAENAVAFGYAETIALADSARGTDARGERAAFIALMRRAEAIAARKP